jgi:hypothetical protein
MFFIKLPCSFNQITINANNAKKSDALKYGACKLASKIQVKNSKLNNKLEGWIIKTVF